MPSDFDLETFLPYRLARATDRVTGALARRFKQTHGISQVDWRILAHLSQQAPLSVREIHAQVGLDKPTVSRAIDRLQAAGSLTKTQDPQDRRLILVALTPAGGALVETLLPLAASFQSDLAHALQGKSLEALLATLDALEEQIAKAPS